MWCPNQPAWTQIELPTTALVISQRATPYPQITSISQLMWCLSATHNNPVHAMLFQVWRRSLGTTINRVMGKLLFLSVVLVTVPARTKTMPHLNNQPANWEVEKLGGFCFNVCFVLLNLFICFTSWLKFPLHSPLLFSPPIQVLLCFCLEKSRPPMGVNKACHIKLR